MHTVYFFIAYQTEATEQMTSQQTITCNIIIFNVNFFLPTNYI